MLYVFVRHSREGGNPNVWAAILDSRLRIVRRTRRTLGNDNALGS